MTEKLRIEDMLAALPEAQAKALRKTLKPLTSAPMSAHKRAKEPSDNIMKLGGALPAPLESTQLARIERKAANDKLEESVDSWNDTVADSSSFCLACPDRMLT